MPQAPDGPRKKVVKKQGVGKAVSAAPKKKISWGKPKQKPAVAGKKLGPFPVPREAVKKVSPRHANTFDPKVKRPDPRVHPATSAGVNLSPLGKKTAAAGLVALKQLNRVASAEGEGAYKAIRAVKTGKPVPAEWAKGVAKGFKENKSGHAKAFKELGVPRKPAAALGFTADVIADPTTYVTAGAMAAPKFAAKTAGRATAKKVVKLGLDKAAAKGEAKRAAGEAVKRAKRREASVRAISAQPESDAIRTQRKQLVDLEARGRGASKKAERIRGNVERAGKRKQARVTPKPAPQAAADPGRAFVHRRQRVAEELASRKSRKGKVVHVGIGSARVKLPVGRRAFGQQRANSGMRRTVNQVAPTVRTDATVDPVEFRKALAVNRSRRAGENIAGHEAQVTANELRRAFPRLSDEEASGWVKAHESGDLSFAPKHMVEGRRVLDDGRVVGRLKGQREVRLATDRGFKAVRRSGQGIGDIELKKGPTLAVLQRESDKMAGKTPSGKTGVRKVGPKVVRASAGGRARDVTAYIKRMEDAQAAQNYYPQSLRKPKKKPTDGLLGRSPSAHIKHREDPRIIAVKNEERAADSKFSENPILDVANYELGAKRVAAHANAATKLADMGRPVKWGRVPTAAVRKDGKGAARPASIRRFTRDEFDAKHGLDENHKVFFVGSRGGKYGLHEVDEATVDSLRRTGGKGAENGRYVVLDERVVATALEGPTGRVSDLPIIGFYDRFSSGYRKIAISTPSYHAVNHFGDTWIMYTVVPGRKVIPYQKKAMPVLRYLQAQEAGKRAAHGLGKRVITVDGEPTTVAKFAKEVMGEGAARQGHYARLEDSQHFAETSVKSSKRGMRPFAAAGRTFRSREDMNRIGTYMYLRDQGERPVDAADRMLEALIDYGQMSKTEREVFRRAALFYMFPARQIPYQTKALFRRPGKFATFEKARRNTAYAFDVDPDKLESEAYFKQAQLGIPFRVGKGDKGVRYAGFQVPANMLNLSLPLGMNAHPELSLTKGPLGNFAQFAGGMLNPLPKVPIELATGYNLFFRQPIQPDTSPSTPAPGWVVSLAKNNPSLVKKLGLVEKRDRTTGKMTWQWNKTPNYILSQATPGPLRYPTDLSRPSNQRGLTKAEQLLRDATGVRLDHSDVHGDQINWLFDKHKTLEDRWEVLQDSKLEGGKEWRDINAGKIELGKQILTESWLRGDKRLLDPENLLPRMLKDRRPSKEQLAFVLRKAEFRERKARVKVKPTAAGPSVPSPPSVPSIP